MTLKRCSAGRYYTGKFFIDHIAGSGWRWYKADDVSTGGEWRRTKTEAVADLLAYQNKVNAETVTLPTPPPAVVVAPEKVKKDKCHSCNGSGKFHFGGATVNGVFTGQVGKCFRCEGKGYQTLEDEKRNAAYDKYYRKS